MDPGYPRVSPLTVAVFHRDPEELQCTGARRLEVCNLSPRAPSPSRAPCLRAHLICRWRTGVRKLVFVDCAGESRSRCSKGVGVNPRSVVTASDVLFIFCLPSRSFRDLKVGLFTVILGGTRSSELINTYLRDRWHEFSRQNYFDEHGIFMGVMWAGPLLLLGFTMLVSIRLRERTDLVGRCTSPSWAAN